MMGRSSLILCLSTAVCTAQAAPAPPEGPRQIRLAPQAAKVGGAFRYRLLPDPRERTPGNAAPLWRLAGDALSRRDKQRTWKKEDEWLGSPLAKLPRKEVRDYLAPYAPALRLARQAALRKHCDWELPPVTFQTVEEYLPLTMLQSCRSLAVPLHLQYRLQLAEGRFDAAAETLQIGFVLAQHLREGDLLIQHLVGIAISAIMFGQVEEWLQTPNSPNLYWALTELSPLPVNLRHCLEYEMNSLYRSFPKLRRLHRETLTEAEADRLVGELFDALSKMSLPKDADSLKKQAAAIRDGAKYAQARKHLLDLGRSTREVDAMPRAQAILLWYVDQYDRAWDDVFKALTVPTWQARPLMEAASDKFGSSENVFLTLLGPTLNKTWFATVRSERQLAGLRCAEALRLYAAKHEGQPPTKWTDAKEVPLPIDPLTGKSFSDFYQVKDGRGILELPPPPPPGMPTSLGRRYELATPRTER